MVEKRQTKLLEPKMLLGAKVKYERLERLGGGVDQKFGAT